MVELPLFYMQKEKCSCINIFFIFKDSILKDSFQCFS